MIILLQFYDSIFPFKCTRMRVHDELKKFIIYQLIHSHHMAKFEPEIAVNISQGINKILTTFKCLVPNQFVLLLSSYLTSKNSLIII